MSKIIDILNKLNAVSGAKKTAEVLEGYKDNADLSFYLHAALDPQFNWYQSDIHIDAIDSDSLVIRQSPKLSLVEAITKLIQLDPSVRRGTTGKRELAKLYWLLADEDDREAFVKVIRRDLKSGCGASTINKVFPDLIRVVPYMRCALAKGASGKKKATYAHFDWDAGVESNLKADGMYANMLADAGTLESRQGTKIPSVHQIDAISQELIKLSANLGADMYVHGELLVIATDSITLYAGTKDEVTYPEGILPREVGNGMINSLVKTGDPLHTSVIVRAVVWDTVTADEMKVGKSSTKRAARALRLRDAVEATEGLELIKFIETKTIYSYEEALEHFAEMTARGEEGTVIKCPNGAWKNGTSNDQLKVKLAFDIDLELYELKDGKANGKYVDTFGSLMLRSRDCKFEVSASGMSVKLRQEIFNNFDALQGKIFTITVNGLQKPTGNNGLWAGFLPRLAKADGKEVTVQVVEERLDKTVADSIEEIVAAFEAASGCAIDVALYQ